MEISPSVAFYTLGCKLNFSETSAIGRQFEEKGYRPGRDLLYVVEDGARHTESAWAGRLPAALRFLLGA